MSILCPLHVHHGRSSLFWGECYSFPLAKGMSHAHGLGPIHIDTLPLQGQPLCIACVCLGAFAHLIFSYNKFLDLGFPGTFHPRMLPPTERAASPLWTRPGLSPRTTVKHRPPAHEPSTLPPPGRHRGYSPALRASHLDVTEFPTFSLQRSCTAPSKHTPASFCHRLSPPHATLPRQGDLESHRKSGPADGRTSGPCSFLGVPSACRPHSVPVVVELRALPLAIRQRPPSAPRGHPHFWPCGTPICKASNRASRGSCVRFLSRGLSEPLCVRPRTP